MEQTESITLYKLWLNKRIIKLKADREKAETIPEKMRIGAKLCGFKETLEYINNH